jgi:putative membrane protein
MSGKSDRTAMDQTPQRASDHLANERTFLAWVRTSISVVVFGFVVAKFGITLRQFFRFENLDPHETGISLALGVSFMIVGILMAILAVWRYQSTRVQIEQADFRPANKIIYVVGAVTALLGAMLVYYLLATTRSL